MIRLLCTWLVALFFRSGLAQTSGIEPGLLTKPWPARWIASPNVSLTDYGVFHFRRSIDLPRKPASFIVHVSADNRYKLFVNGQYVAEGPQRSDVPHWRFETIDLAPYLQAGKNVLAAQVWNFGEQATLSQMSYRTGFILQGNSRQEQVANTNDAWVVKLNPAYRPIPYGPISFNTYYVAGPGDDVDGSRHLWGWEQPEYNDQDWQKPRLLSQGAPQGTQNFDNWQLVPRSIPPLERKPQRFALVRRATGAEVPSGFLVANAPLTIPAQSRVVILLDQQVLTTAYPQLTVSGGQGSEVLMTYSEALWDEQGRKGHRDAIDGRKIVGNHDRFRPDGFQKRTFEPLWYRTFRYVQLGITTGAEPLTLHQVSSVFSAYPFVERAQFTSDDPMLQTIWDTGWRTARLCAYESYMDCPYYEQLQYIGDTRIQALISLYVSGDDRLMRETLQQFDWSRMPEGLTMSRYPSRLPQYIPPFSLLWVSMVHDYWMHRKDDAFVRQFLPGISQVLGWFERQVNDRAMVPVLPYWNFIDHTYPVERITNGGSRELAANGLFFAYALNHAEPLFRHFGQMYEADRYRTLSRRLTDAVSRTCYDTRRQLIADTPDKNSFSQQVNVMAVLTDAVSQPQQANLLERTLNDTSLIQSTIYFQFYHFRALRKAGLGDQYTTRLNPWRTMLNEGLTTFAEMEKNTRSDCHAWSASPNYDLLAIVCGIEPTEPGFRTVRITPHLGPLSTVSGRMPHLSGDIHVTFRRNGPRGLQGEVQLPPDLTGTLHWHGTQLPLHGGRQTIRLN